MTRQQGDDATMLRRTGMYVSKVVAAGASRPTKDERLQCMCLCAWPTALVADDGTQKQQSKNGEVLHREKAPKRGPSTRVQQHKMYLL